MDRHRTIHPYSREALEMEEYYNECDDYEFPGYQNYVPETAKSNSQESQSSDETVEMSDIHDGSDGSDGSDADDENGSCNSQGWENCTNFEDYADYGYVDYTRYASQIQTNKSTHINLNESYEGSYGGSYEESGNNIFSLWNDSDDEYYGSMPNSQDDADPKYLDMVTQWPQVPQNGEHKVGHVDNQDSEQLLKIKKHVALELLFKIHYGWEEYSEWYTDQECTICMESMQDKYVLMLPCHDLYHHDCILEAVEHGMRTCPDCQQFFKKTDAPEDYYQQLKQL